MEFCILCLAAKVHKVRNVLEFDSICGLAVNDLRNGLTMTEYDSPWKEAIDLLFEDFMLLCFPAIHKLYSDN